MVLVEGTTGRVNKPCERMWKELFEEGLVSADSRILELRELSRQSGGKVRSGDLRTRLGKRFVEFISGEAG